MTDPSAILETEVKWIRDGNKWVMWKGNIELEITEGKGYPTTWYWKAWRSGPLSLLAMGWSKKLTTAQMSARKAVRRIVP